MKKNSAVANRILYISQWFEPEPVLKGKAFVQGLKKKGYSVQTVTGFPNYPQGKVYPGYRLRIHQRENLGGTEIDRVLLYPNHSRSSVRRIANYFSFALSAAIFGIFRARRFDIAYVYPPIPSALAAAAICAIRRRPFIMDVQDLWPDSVTTSGMPGVRWMDGLLGWMCRFAYRHASLIIAQSEGIANRLAERGVSKSKIKVIYNWAHENLPQGQIDRKRLAFEGHFNFVYAGNLGTIQGLDTLIDAAALASQTVPEIKLTLIGNGVEQDRLSKRIANEGGFVQLLPAVPREEIGDILASAEVLTLHLVDDPLFTITVPHKTQSYLAARKPVLAAVAGEAAKIVTDAGAGVAAPPGDAQAIAQAMIAMARMPSEELTAMSERAYQSYRRSFSFDIAMRETSDALQLAWSKYHNNKHE